MGFMNKESRVPDELKDLGLTPAQMREAILDRKKLTEDLERSKTEASTLKSTVAALEGRFNETKATLDNLEANSRRAAQPKQEPKEYTSFIDDENKAFTERLVDGLQPVTRVALQAAANSAKITAKMSLQGQYVDTPGGKISLTRLWERWIGEIDKAAGEVSLMNLGNVDTWTNLFDYIKGKHFNELMAQPETFVESVATNQDRTVGDDKQPKKLSDMEAEVIRKQSRYGKGVTPEGYQKTKEGMTFVNV
jgi:hypothetical protein